MDNISLLEKISVKSEKWVFTIFTTQGFYDFAFIYHRKQDQTVDFLFLSWFYKNI